MSSNDVAVNNMSIHSVTRSSLVHRIDFIFRSVFLFGRDVLSGVHVNGPSTDRRRIVTTTGTTRYRRFVSGLPNKCRAIINSGNVRLSNNRHRQVTVTQTVVGGSPVVILSRTATFDSPRGRCLVRGTFRGLVRNGAIVVVTRHLSAVHGTSGVVIVRGKRLVRRKGRSRLISTNKHCTRV